MISQNEEDFGYFPHIITKDKVLHTIYIVSFGDHSKRYFFSVELAMNKIREYVFKENIDNFSEDNFKYVNEEKINCWFAVSEKLVCFYQSRLHYCSITEITYE